MRRRGEDRLVEHVFPIAGEFLLGGDAAGERAGAAAGAADHHALADLGRARGADGQRRQIDRTQRLHQAEAGLLVEGERMAFHHAAVAEMQPDGRGLGDQVADGQHQAVVDQHAVAGALDPQRFGGEAVGRDDRMQTDHRGQRALEIVGIVLRARLRRGWHLPFGQRGHGGLRLFSAYHTPSDAGEKMADAANMIG